MSDIRSFLITGGAVADYMGEKKKKGGRRTKKSQEGGTVINVASFTSDVPTATPATATATPALHSSAATHSPMPSPSAPGVPSHTVTSKGGDYKGGDYKGGDYKGSDYTLGAGYKGSDYTLGAGYKGSDYKHVKVELKKKPTTHKVKLQPKKDAQKKLKSKKTRKFTIGISALHKRVTRAKKVHKKVKEMPLAALKELLIRKKLIKSTSVAPESVLRQIAADSHIIDKNAL
jgi:hypothetical protein